MPFGRVTEILKENGFELIQTTLFRDHYGAQTQTVLVGDLQEFSFLHRSFVFKRGTPPKKEEEPEAEEETKEEPKEAVQEVVVPTTPESASSRRRSPRNPAKSRCSSSRAIRLSMRTDS